VTPLIDVGVNEDLVIEHFGEQDTDESVSKFADQLEENWR